MKDRISRPTDGRFIAESPTSSSLWCLLAGRQWCCCRSSRFDNLARDGIVLRINLRDHRHATRRDRRCHCSHGLGRGVGGASDLGVPPIARHTLSHVIVKTQLLDIGEGHLQSSQICTYFCVHYQLSDTSYIGIHMIECETSLNSSLVQGGINKS